jgi:hypothetical protein
MKGKIIVLVAISALLSACGKIATVNSPREKADISLVENARYDPESKIRYMVSNDNTHFYFRFDTDNFGTIMRVRKQGAIVRFDTQGKRKGTHYLKYPVYETETAPALGAGDDPRALPGGMVRSALFPPTTTAAWADGGVLRTVDLGLNKEGFICHAGLDDKDVLVYFVGVPFSLIGGTKPEDFPNLNVELEIPSPDGTQKLSGNSNSSMPTGVSSGMPGAMNSGMNTMPGGGINNQPGGSMGAAPMMSSGGVSGIPDIRIWMHVKLSPSTAP